MVFITRRGCPHICVLQWKDRRKFRCDDGRDVIEMCHRCNNDVMKENCSCSLIPEKGKESL